MHLSKAHCFYGFLIGILFSSVNGEDAKCICADKNGAYFTSGEVKNVCTAESQQRESTFSENLTKLTATLEAFTNSIVNITNKHSQDSPLQINYYYSRSCAEATANTRRSGTYSIQVESFMPKSFQVSCDEDLFGGGWTVILRRKDGSVDFFRDWASYKQGFGNFDGEFFIGLDKLYALTTGQYPQELIFVLEDFDNVQKYAKYSSFAIGDESERYVLKTLGTYTGDAGDSFTSHAGAVFKTKEIEDVNNCATRYTGAWWYKACHSSNLCGSYLKGAYGQEKYAQGVAWHAWRGHNYSLKFVQMMIRPKRL